MNFRYSLDYKRLKILMHYLQLLHYLLFTIATICSKFNIYEKYRHKPK